MVKEKRADIQVLRAVAVLLVIVFHLNKEWLPSGYLGVDIFFVISGFVISRGIIYRAENGLGFSARKFLQRRINRLLLPLFLVLVVNTILGFLLYPPETLENLATSTVYALGGLSNIYFFTQTNYFAAPLDRMPNLHTWSLSVEEQFYIVFAVLMTVFARLNWASSRQLIRFWLLAFAISLFFYLNPDIITNNWKMIDELKLENASAAFRFFMLPSRFFQLALGIIGSYLLLYLDINRITIKQRKIVWICSTLSMLAIIVFAPTKLGEVALTLPITFLVFIALVSGEGISFNPSTALNLLVKIGDRSYSLYLVHWPAVVFSSFYFLGFEKYIPIITSVMATAVLGELSYRYAEKGHGSLGEHIKRSGLENSPIFFYTILIFFPLQFLIFQSKGLPSRISTMDDTKFFDYKKDFEKEEIPLKGYQENGTWSSFSSYMPRSHRITKRILVLGDSHAKYLSGIAKYYASTRGQKWDMYTFTGCPPILGYYKIYDIELKKETPQQAACRNQVKIWQEYLNKNHENYDIVVLSSRWNWMFQHKKFGQQSIRKDALALAGSKNIPSLEKSRENFISGLRQTVQFIKNKGLKVVVFGQAPLSSAPPKDCFYVPDYLFTNAMMKNRCNFDKFEDQVDRSSFVDNVLKNREKYGIPKFTAVVATDFFCDRSQKICHMLVHGRPILSDTNHYSEYGALYLAKTLEMGTDFPFK